MKIITGNNTNYDAGLRCEAEETPAAIIRATLFRTVFLFFFAFEGKVYVCMATFRVRMIHPRYKHTEYTQQFIQYVYVYSFLIFCFRHPFRGRVGHSRRVSSALFSRVYMAGIHTTIYLLYSL